MPLALEPSAESDGEKSMDLATPLHSIVILPTVSDSQAVDPPSIPLPLSPSSSGSESSWATSLGSPSPASSRRLSTSVPMLSDRSTASVEALPISTGSRGRRYDMEEIEEELALTRRELEMREDAMRELRGLVAHLQRQIATDDGSETIVIGFVPP
ncbi:hypothetical protein PLICRDRAFT_55094 [Plicaturopsis crispa FD-325 SS-3]|nr:hypothetical protein PLICRDRAFT_55094 [Plicaturopsis crispa FD-325 SS-3]